MKYFPLKFFLPFTDDESVFFFFFFFFFFLTNALFISYVFPAVIEHKPNLCKSRVNTVVIHGQGMLSRIFNNESYLFPQ